MSFLSLTAVGSLAILYNQIMGVLDRSDKAVDHEGAKRTLFLRKVTNPPEFMLLGGSRNPFFVEFDRFSQFAFASADFAAMKLLCDEVNIISEQEYRHAAMHKRVHRAFAKGGFKSYEGLDTDICPAEHCTRRG